MKNGVVWIYEHGEDGKKCQERDNTRIEDVLVLHSITHVGVESRETLEHKQFIRQYRVSQSNDHDKR